MTIRESLLQGSYLGLSENLQEAGDKEIVFYNLKPEQGAIDLFLKRLEASKAAVVIVGESGKSIQNKRVLSVTNQELIELKTALLDHFYPIPQRHLLIGVTGTNGKSSVVSLVAQLCRQRGKRCYSLGTLGLLNERGEQVQDFGLTTPSETDLRKILASLPKDTALALEVSSHALDQKRLGKVRLSFAGWTSFSQDHLDYHKTTDQYFEAKKKIFEVTASPPLFVPWRETSLIERLKGQPVRQTRRLSEEQLNRLSPAFRLSFNQSNLELANELVSAAFGEDKHFDGDGLVLPKGRLEVIPRGEGQVFIDYAHTPDALSRVCAELKESFSERPLWVVFGCGGNRDRSKRPLMYDCVVEHADQCYLTSDNPRDEDPMSIIEDMLRGRTSSRVKVEVNRKIAIEKTLEMAPQNAVILIAGKGHEEYQEIAGIKHKFSDVQVVNDYLGKGNG